MLLGCDLRAAIEHFYDITITHAAAGARGMTGAVTYVLTDHDGARYFCKCVTDPHMQARMRHSLAAVAELSRAGLSFVVAPLSGADGYALLHNTTLVALFPYIDAAPTRNYAATALGAMLGAIHNATRVITTPLPQQGYATVYHDFFTHELPSFIEHPRQDDTPLGRLRSFLQHHTHVWQRYFDVFNQLSQRTPRQCVLTHGDPQGNILQDKQGDLYLIDWDEAELAPAERDLWFLAGKAGFLESYTTVRGGFTPDARDMLHAALKAWLEGFAIILQPALHGHGDADHCRSMLAQRRLSDERLARLDAAIHDTISA